jgi:hypothetical protein
MMLELPDGRKCYQWNDDMALAWLRINFPDLEAEMISEAKGIPVYDGKEVIVLREFFTINPDAYILLSYVHGNDDPKYDGWVLRMFGGVKQNTDEHIKIIRSLEVLSNTKMNFSND